jgi:hypothetical protein
MLADKNHGKNGTMDIRENADMTMLVCCRTSFYMLKQLDV